MGDHDENGCACEMGLPCMPAAPPEPAAPVVHASDGKMRPVCGAALDRGDSVRRFGVTCPACVEAPEPDEAERTARDWLDAMSDGGWHAGGGADALATLLRAAEARGRERGLELAEQAVARVMPSIPLRADGDVEPSPFAAMYIDAVRALRSGR